MAAMGKLPLTTFFLLISQISGLQTGNASQEACESSKVDIVFNFNLNGESVMDRSWYLNFVAHKIAEANSRGVLSVEPQYNSRVTLFGSTGITLSHVNISDSGSYLFIIVTAMTYNVGTATTTLTVHATPNNSCRPVIENNANSFTCKIPDTCPGNGSIQARWDVGAVDVFTCPLTTVSTKYKCCAEGTPVKKCYNGSLCTDIECKGDPCVSEPIKHSIIGIVICIIFFCIDLIILIIFIIKLGNRVVIQNKDVLQRPTPVDTEVTITAIIYGFWISRVEWIRKRESERVSEWKLLANLKEYTIVPYDINTGKTSLTIKNLSITDNGSYICKSRVQCGFSAKDSITISHGETSPIQQPGEISPIPPPGGTSPIPLPGYHCPHKLLLGLGLGLGIQYIACIIVIVILLSIGIAVAIIVILVRKDQKKTKTGNRAASKREHLQFQMNQLL